jgi:hypothetical protein
VSYDAFVSYAKLDVDWVSSLCEALKARGVALWVDTSYLQPPWRDSVRDGIRSSRSMVLVLSRNWEDSGACRYELDVALELKKPLLTIKVDRTAASAADELMERLSASSGAS